MILWFRTVRLSETAQPAVSPSKIGQFRTIRTSAFFFFSGITIAFYFLWGRAMEKRKPMNVLIYSPGRQGERLQAVIRDLVPGERLEAYETFQGFAERLRKPMDEIPLAVILAATEEDLLAIMSISHLLCDVRFILILPDREDVTVAIGHSLRPRFMSYADSDFKEVTAVLGKMIGGFYFSRRTRGFAKSHTYPIGRAAGREVHYKKLAP
jgi:hypothetical protein